MAASIEDKIMARDLKDGDSLPAETDLARQFRVNRSTVREALRELQSKGLVARREGGKRLFVSHPQAADVASGVSRALAQHGVKFLEVWEVMMIIEPQAAALAARKREGPQLEELVELNARFEALSDRDQAVATVVEFFRTLARCSQNRVLVMAQAPLTRLLSPTLGRMIDQVPQARARIVAAQRHLIEAIRARNADEACSWMEKHIRDFKRGYELAGIGLDYRVAL
ncbi:MAG: FCD domain-containing protein [Gemmatimonadetes bacterium]|nr:FCD domain-containing protein [Gemmatimonadota bacterium]